MPNTDDIIQLLHPVEIQFLLLDLKDPFQLKDIQESFPQANQVLSWLTQKELLKKQFIQKKIVYELTSLGQSYVKQKAFPIQLMIQYLSKNHLSMEQLAKKLTIEHSQLGSAFGFMAKNKIVYMDEEKNIHLSQDYLQNPLFQALASIMKLSGKQEVIDQNELNEAEKKIIQVMSAKRNISHTFKLVEQEIYEYYWQPLGLKIKELIKQTGKGNELSSLTPAMLLDKSWKGKKFRPFNINSPPKRVLLGRSNPYAQFLEQVSRKFVSMGFQQLSGFAIESEFWNSDALFMPQFHPARNIHDVYYVKDSPDLQQKIPKTKKEKIIQSFQNNNDVFSIPEDLLEKVKQVHENGGNTQSKGWRYQFSEQRSRRLILRSQATGLSARQLATLSEQEDPSGRFFAMTRCFRHDQVDATHLSDFIQIDGIILEKNANFRTLLGFLEMLAKNFAQAQKVRFNPAYFPFTEPSIEMHVQHPELGWVELGGAGILRPEVTEPLGITEPVLAWGLGIDRMALLALKLQDLRDLFTFDLDSVRLKRTPYAYY